jgi:amino acid adenylation domain-containing protein/non-ribosomal peptide synthase protein (TIGR01720 family)
MQEAYVFPASFAQQRLWFLNELVPGNPFYNIGNAVRLSRRIEADVLERSLNEIVRRHESLRTTFRTVEGEAVQVISPSQKLQLRVVDLRYLKDDQREAETVQIATDHVQKPFDLERGPLLRASLLELGDEHFVFLLAIHHIVADGWSLEVFFRELSILYSAFLAGSPSPLPELAIQYADYAVSQRAWLRGAEGENQLAYWMEQLRHLPVLRMPTDRPRPAKQSFKGATHSFWVEEGLRSAMAELSQRENVTQFMTLLAAFLTLLYRYTSQIDIVVGAPIANRNRSEIENLIGFFVNSLVLRVDLSGDPSFSDLLKRVRKVTLEAYDHQDLPFEKLVKELNPERDLGRNPLFQVSFQLFSSWEVPTDIANKIDSGQYFSAEAALTDADRRDPRDEHFDGESVDVDRGTSNIDLAVDMFETSGGLYAEIEYSSDLFDTPTIVRLKEHLLTLLSGIVANPKRRISELSVLTDAEQERVLLDWNKTDVRQPKELLLHRLFEKQAESTPEAVAVEFQAWHMTYGQLERKANQLAHYLMTKGIGPESLVAVCMDRSLEMIIVLLGILKAGGAYLPLDPNYPQGRLTWMLDDARPAMLITQRDFANRLASGTSACLFFDELNEALSACSEAVPSAGVLPNHLCYVIYTSGSTGRSKGVMVEHQAVCNHLLWMQDTFPLSWEDRIAQKYSLSFDVAALELFGPLLAGARLVVTHPTRTFDLDYFIPFLIEHQITVLDLVPSILQVLLEDERTQSCHALRRVICGGETMSMELQKSFFAKMDGELINIYGPTEATIGTTYWRCRLEYPEDSVPIGRPIANTQVYLLDPDMNALPVGIPGELYIGGDCLARGYLHQPDLTADRFIPSPFSKKAGSRLYKTGDRARYLSDGNIQYLGRRDEQVKLRGYRIEPAEIESELMAHSSVRDCAVAAKESELSDTKLVAYIVPVPNPPEFWPSVGEYSVYDELLYYAMTHDERRNQAYRVAINRFVSGKTVVDIGTGPDALLARFCVEAGASKVYAIERREDTYRRAEQLLETTGLKDRITLLHGDSARIELPEQVDVCVSELIGTIGSSEGVVPILNDARRFLKPQGITIPQKCVTRIAAVRLPEELASRPRLNSLPRHYIGKVFEAFGYPFDLRLCLKNFPLQNVVSDSAVFEELNFHDYIAERSSLEITLTIKTHSKLHGLLLWLNLYPVQDELIDTLLGGYSWLPVFLPVLDGVEVTEGDMLGARCCRRLGERDQEPDYEIRGILSRRGGEEIPFEYQSVFRTKAYRHNSFYDSLFREFAPTSQGMSASDWSSEQVSRWKRIYEEIYQLPSTDEDRTFNTVGWNSSYTGLPIPAEQMREQVKHTVTNILRLKPKNVMEVGCGTGLLLLRIAPRCTGYVGTDFSSAALNYTRQRVCELGLSNVQLLESNADVSFGESGQYDTIILNSVVQYFPGIDYLVRVLEKAVHTLLRPGHIFVGDVRSLRLLEAFYASVELEAASASMSTREFRDRVRKRMGRDQELVIDPEFFRAIQEHLPEIGRVQIQPKRGWNHNELTAFRYDAILDVGAKISVSPDPTYLDWRELGGIEALKELLADTGFEGLGVRGIPNARLKTELMTVRLLADPNGPKCVGDLRGALAKHYQLGIEPEELWQLGEELSCEVTLEWSGPGMEDNYDVVFMRPKAGQLLAGRTARDRDRGRKPWGSYANDPQQRDSVQSLVPALREFLQERVPEYMVPSKFVVVEALPRTPTGKLDRQALHAFEPVRSMTEEAHVAPRNELEQILSEIWGELLGLDRVGVHDNFFELGGDSILSIQVVTRARRNGVRLTPMQLFRHQTIAGLAAVADTIPAIQAEQGVARGSVPLTPVQHWFFEQALAESHHYNQALYLNVPRDWEVDKLESVMRQLLVHHDALRLRYRVESGAWVQTFAEGADERVLGLVDLTKLGDSEQAEAMRDHAAGIQASLNLGTGPLLRGTLFDLGEEESNRLLLVIHHLVVDAVSWRILLEDLETAYGQVSLGSDIQLPPKTTSFRQWAQRLTEYAQTKAVESEMEYWLKVGRAEIKSLPVDFPGGLNTGESLRYLVAALSVEETRVLVQEVPRAHQTQINEVLLTALSHAFTNWTREPTILIDLEGHGREPLFEDVDLTRTVGWFTTIFPVILGYEKGWSTADNLKSVKEQVRRIPNRGIGFGLLRYLSRKSNIADKLRGLARPEVAFNYLGLFAAGEMDIEDGEDLTGPAVSPCADRPYLLEINASVSNGELRTEWAYNENLHRRSTVERLAEGFLTALRSLIAYCSSAQVGGYTPSDFPAARISQSELDKLISTVQERDQSDTIV